MATRAEHIHFVGIGGIGMSALALLLSRQGKQVSGTDRTDSVLLDSLRKAGIDITIGHSAAAVEGADLLVYSSAIKADNPERVYAHSNGIPEIRRAEMLGQIARAYQHTVAIAGTHGKTTTTGMCGQILIEAGLDPSILVGGILPNLDSNLRLGALDTIVVEADEYDRSFLALSPDRILVTTLEADHLDIYKDLQDVRDTFFQFISKLDEDSILILAGDDQELRDLGSRSPIPPIYYGVSKSVDYQATNIKNDTFSSQFTVVHGGRELGTIKLNMPGIHNILNALGSLSMSMEMGIEFAAIKQGLESFQGVERRFERKGTLNGVLFVDDYAHHPSEVAATLKAAQNGWPDSRIIAVFQPHLYSRTRDFAPEFAEALQIADLAIVTDIYPAREKPILGVDSRLITDSSQTLLLKPTMQDVLQFLEGELQENDILITLGAGDIWKLHELFLKGNS
ncbi:MAG: UDP-N-acetylmuramate--L-alanine ligase [Candidatus Marinimicrobia bacterium]|nr:UDP-N-acetylmuramate--L-alanine ligase [Candidatus Neomarinimicrobiota bacterium]MCF7850118.1 UDP-N-acetylmuramate--L-alanine ligase [Candidatus Neomarinimicrobiota bacterium]MCF7905526.1 UDP-N-acetylmuramate--L-alanine ligase [Candidatus Neomarinimicrobiota bacterium]